MTPQIEHYGFFKTTTSGQKVAVIDAKWCLGTPEPKAGETIVLLDDETYQPVAEVVVKSLGKPFQIGGRGTPKVYVYTGESAEVVKSEDQFIDDLPSWL